MGMLSVPVVYGQLFRASAFAQVEYSYDALMDREGTMVGGGPSLLAPILKFAAALPFSGEWAWSISRFAQYVSPDTYLFRTDWSRGEVENVTLYCRFPKEPSDDEFAAALVEAWPFTWSGARPSAISSLLNVAGPRGVGLRVSASGSRRVALYFTVKEPMTSFPTGQVGKLVASCELPVAVAALIEADLRGVYLQGPVGTIGLDDASETGPGALKFNPANLPIERAFAFLAAKRAGSQVLERLTRISRSLRALLVSYLGLRYDVNGFSGWRAYFSVEPRNVLAPISPLVVTERSAIPTLRLPHY